MPRPPLAREKVLDAFEAILIEEGERAATLEATAKAAGVSKFVYTSAPKATTSDLVLAPEHKATEEAIAANRADADSEISRLLAAAEADAERDREDGRRQTAAADGGVRRGEEPRGGQPTQRGTDRPDEQGDEPRSEQGERHEADFDGLLATALQHEIDHLNGKLFIDYLGLMKRQLITRKMEKLKRERARSGP